MGSIIIGQEWAHIMSLNTRISLIFPMINNRIYSRYIFKIFLPYNQSQTVTTIVANQLFSFCFLFPTIYKENQIHSATHTKNKFINFNFRQQNFLSDLTGIHNIPYP